MGVRHKSCRSRACSSIPSRSSRPRASTCCATFWSGSAHERASRTHSSAVLARPLARPPTRPSARSASPRRRRARTRWSRAFWSRCKIEGRDRRPNSPAARARCASGRVRSNSASTRRARYLRHRRRRRGHVQHLDRRRADRGGRRRAGRQARQPRDQRHGRRRRRARSASACKIDLRPAGLARCLDARGMLLHLRAAYHPAMARLAALRRDARIAHAFNLMGAAGESGAPRCQLLGVAEPQLSRPIARRWRRSAPSTRWWCMGTTASTRFPSRGRTEVAEVRGERLPSTRSRRRTSASRARVRAALRADDADASGEAAAARAWWRDAAPAQDVLALNGGAAIYVGGKAHVVGARASRWRAK